MRCNVEQQSHVPAETHPKRMRAPNDELGTDVAVESRPSQLLPHCSVCDSNEIKRFQRSA